LRANAATGIQAGLRSSCLFLFWHRTFACAAALRQGRSAPPSRQPSRPLV